MLFFWIFYSLKKILKQLYYGFHKNIQQHNTDENNHY